MVSTDGWGIFSLSPAIPSGSALQTPAFSRPASHVKFGRVILPIRREAL